MNAWITGASAYCCQPLKAFAINPIWTADPNHAAYAKASETLAAERLCRAARLRFGGVMADYVLVDMFAEAATGQASPEDAVAKAEKRANRYYRV